MKDFYIKDFSPKGKKYYFSCSEDFCYKTKHGICSLDLTDDEVSFIPPDEYPRDDNVNYCRKIYKSIINEGQKYPIYICNNKCGHYTFDDGQHRVCIASKKELKLKAEVYQIDDLCHMCRRENKIINAISNVGKLVKETTPKKTILHYILRLEPQGNFQDSLDRWKKDLIDLQSEKEESYREF